MHSAPCFEPHGLIIPLSPHSVDKQTTSVAIRISIKKQQSKDNGKTNIDPHQNSRPIPTRNLCNTKQQHVLFSLGQDTGQLNVGWLVSHNFKVLPLCKTRDLPRLDFALESSLSKCKCTQPKWP